MHTITETFKDFDGNEVQETFYFNLTEEEAIELQFSHQQGFAEYLQSVTSSGDTGRVLAVFKDLVLKTYGEKSKDGRHFDKNDDIRRRFSQHAAFSQIYVGLATDAEKAADFVNAVVPTDLLSVRAAEGRQVRRPSDRQRKQQRPPRRINTESGVVVGQLEQVPDEEEDSSPIGRVVELPKTIEDYSPVQLMRLDESQRKALMDEFEERQEVQYED